jgi:hypothetical protein
VITIPFRNKRHRFESFAYEETIRNMAGAGLTRLSEEWRDSLERPLMSEELKATINKEHGNKAPGRDGIGLV